MVTIICDGCRLRLDIVAVNGWHSRAIANARAAGWTCDDWDMLVRNDHCPDCTQKLSEESRSGRQVP